MQDPIVHVALNFYVRVHVVSFRYEWHYLKF